MEAEGGSARRMKTVTNLDDFGSRRRSENAQEVAW